MTNHILQISRFFENMFDVPATVLSIRKDRKSFKNDCLIVETSVGKFLLKLGPLDQPSPFFNVVNTSQLLLQAGVKVPAILEFEHGNQVFGRPFVIQEWLEGEDAEDLLPRLTDEQKKQWMVAFGRTVAKFHTLTNPDFFGDVAGRNRFVTWEDFLRNHLEYRLEQNKQKGTLSPASLERVYHHLEPRLKHLYAGAPCLTHLDLHLPNILQLRNGEIGLIDFEYTKYGDPYRDFVKLHMFVFPLDSRFEAWFFEGYCEQKPLEKNATERIRVYKLMEYLAGIPFFMKNQPELAAKCKEELEREISLM